jgi:ABC-2 type transport system permease protein
MIDVRMTRLVADREIREQLRGKAMWISTAITLLGVILVIVLPHVLASGVTTYRIAVTGSPPTTVTAGIEQATRDAGARAELVSVPDRAAAEAALRSGATNHVDLAVDTSGQGSVVVDRAFPPGSTERKALVAQAIARGVAVAKAIAASGLMPQQAAAITNPQPLSIDHLRAAPTSTAHRALALGAAIVFFLLVIWYGNGLLTGVVQEKSSRVVEVILSALRPVELLAGKVLGTSLLVFGQATLLVAAALISAKAVGSDILSGNGAGDTVVAGIWIVLGFILYASLFAAAGALASRVEDAQSVGLPLQIPLIVGYFVSFTVLGSGTPNALVTVLAYVPFTAPMNMPVLVATGGAHGWQVGVSMLITAATIALTLRLASAIFARAILRTGQRVKLRAVLGQVRSDAASVGQQ